MGFLPDNIKEKLIFSAQILCSKLLNSNIPEPNQVHKILVVKLDEIGDLCYSLHVFDLIARHYPHAKITLCCKPYCNSLVQSHPNIHYVVNGFNGLNQKYDIVLDLRGNWESIWFSLKNRPKLYLERGSTRLTNKRKGSHPHEVIANCQIIEPITGKLNEIPYPKLYLGEENIRNAENFIAENELNNFVIVHPGARKPLKKWKTQNFASICKWLHNKGFKIVIAGDKTELNEIENLKHLLDFISYTTAHKLNLTDFAALVVKAKLYLGNDSGPLSIASVSGTPSLGLYGPGVPYVFYPYGPHTDYIHFVLDCNPCDQYNCVKKHHNCMDMITIEEVKSKINSLLHGA